MMPDSSNHRTVRSKSIKKYFRLPFWNISFQDFIGCTCTRCKALFNLTLSKRHILDCSKLKQFADDSFKFDEMAESSPKGREHYWKRRNCSL